MLRNIVIISFWEDIRTCPYNGSRVHANHEQIALCVGAWFQIPNPWISEIPRVLPIRPRPIHQKRIDTSSKVSHTSHNEKKGDNDDRYGYDNMIPIHNNSFWRMAYHMMISRLDGKETLQNLAHLKKAQTKNLQLLYTYLTKYKTKSDVEEHDSLFVTNLFASPNNWCIKTHDTSIVILLKCMHHYPNQSWLIISEDPKYSPESKFTGITKSLI